LFPPVARIRYTSTRARIVIISCIRFLIDTNGISRRAARGPRRDKVVDASPRDVLVLRSRRRETVRACNNCLFIDNDKFVCFEIVAQWRVQVYSNRSEEKSVLVVAFVRCRRLKPCPRNNLAGTVTWLFIWRETTRINV